ncbi:MAG: SMP-30/gluconolactonase/LRE family protein [Ferruginibacter sp.]
MKKKLFLFMCVLCSAGFYSCQKDINDSVQDGTNDASLSKSFNGKRISDCPTSLTHGPFAEVPFLHEATDVFTEGPAVDKHGNVFFTDQNHDKIYRWDAKTSNVTLWLTGTGRSNGMEFDDDGNLIACADMHGEIWKIRPNGSHQVLVNNYRGKLLNGPNDVWINSQNAGIYITDPIFPRSYWDDSDPRKQDWEPTHSEQAATGKGGHVYYLAKGSHRLVRVTNMPGWNADSWPNGIVGTPDGKKLYVNQWSSNGSGGIWVFDIRRDGTLTNMKTFVAGLNFCDGMSLDEWGNIYVCADGGVQVYNPKGRNILTIPVPSANNVFAGKDEKTLFITGGGSGMIYTQRMNIKGVEKFGDDHGHWNGHD